MSPDTFNLTLDLVGKSTDLTNLNPQLAHLTLDMALRALALPSKAWGSMVDVAEWEP